MYHSSFVSQRINIGRNMSPAIIGITKVAISLAKKMRSD